MPGCSSARSEDARVSATSSPARRSAASSSGRESGLRPGASNASRTSATRASSPCGRAPRGGRGPSRSVEQALVDVDPPRHPGVRHLGRDEGARGLGREQQAEPGRLGRRGHARPAAGRPRGRRAGARPCRRPRTAPDRTPRLGPSRSQCSDSSPSSSCPSTAGARRSRWWPSRRSWQRSTRTPAASSGGYHRAVSSHTQRGASASRSAHVRRQVGSAERAARCHRRPTSTRSPGRRESETRVTGTPWHPPRTATGPWRRMGSCRARPSRSTRAWRRTR